MPRSSTFTALVMTSFFAASLACGYAAAQDATAPKPSQDAAAKVEPRDPHTGLSAGKRQHQPMTITKELDKPATHHTMADMDTDKDGRLSRSEFAAAHGGKTDEFAAHDGNGDGFISQAEMDAHHASMKANHEAAQDAGKPQH